MSWCCSPDRAVSRGTPPCRLAWGTPLLAWASQAGGLRDAAGTGLGPRGGTRRGLERPLPTRLGCPAYMPLSPPDSPFQPHPAMPLTSERTQEEPGRKGSVGRTDSTGHCLPFVQKTTNCTRVLGTWLGTYCGAPARRLPVQAQVGPTAVALRPPALRRQFWATQATRRQSGEVRRLPGQHGARPSSPHR